MELVQATPSPPSSIRAPPTPKHGYEDHWDPYSPRKSARLAQRQNNHRTPSPQSSFRRSDRLDHHPISASPQSKKNHRTNAAMTSPVASPRKKNMSGESSSRRVSGSLTAESTANAAAALGLPTNGNRSSSKKTDGRSTRSTAAAAAASASDAAMLPTPAKTPQKPPTEQNKANVRAVARNLFHHSDDDTDQAMLSPRKTRTRKHHVLDSFGVGEPDDAIPIFTDSHERIPEVDRSADNPFYGPQAPPASEPAKRRSKRQQVTVPGEGPVSIDEAIRRQDGMLIVFRGKKEFRKFSDDALGSGAVDEGESGLEGAVESNLRRPLTRSSVKPRLLFPAKPQAEADEEDEEAATDIEDPSLHQTTQDAPPHTPSDVEEAPDTPVAPKFAPASPPTTARTTRHGTKTAQDNTPVKSTRGGKRSPFDGWRRVKNGSASQGQKRSGDPLGTDPVKRARA